MTCFCYFWVEEILQYTVFLSTGTEITIDEVMIEEDLMIINKKLDLRLLLFMVSTIFPIHFSMDH